MRTGIWVFFIFLIFGCENSSHVEKDEATAMSLAESDTTLRQEITKRKVILFFGNSLTAGYGVDPEDAFTSIIQNKLDSLSYPYEVINAGVSGETTASGNSRLDWVLKQQDIDVFVLELGANDGLRGIPTKETRSNLTEMIDKVRKAEPGVKILLTGMMVPPNMGDSYGQSFAQIFSEVANNKEINLMPFLLKDVAGEPQFNIEDGIHPNEKGHKIIAENLWSHLEGLLISSKQN